jgi:hypothetical protein
LVTLRLAIVLCASLGLTACGDDAPHSARSEKTPAAKSVVTTFTGRGEGIAAFLAPLPDPSDDATWHRDRIGQIVAVPAGCALYALRLFVAEAAAAPVCVDELEIRATDAGGEREFRDLAVPPPDPNEAPELRVLRGRTRLAFAGVELNDGEGCELWLVVDDANRPIEQVTLEFADRALVLTPRSVAIEQVAEVIARPTKANLRAVAEAGEKRQ